LEQVHLDRTRSHLGHTAVETKRPLLIERIKSEQIESFAQGDEHLAMLRAMEPRSLIELPLLIRGEILGVLVFISSTPDRLYGPADLPFAEAIAERAALAIENGRLYQQAVHATELRDEVLGIVAHDLRNPLSSILLQSQLLRPPDAGPDRRSHRPAEVIQRAAKRMNRLIRDLLDVSTMEAGRFAIEHARISPSELLAEFVEAQRPMAAASTLELRLDVSDELPDIWGDSSRVLQVLENLIGNASKFTAPGGLITIGVAARSYSGSRTADAASRPWAFRTSSTVSGRRAKVIAKVQGSGFRSHAALSRRTAEESGSRARRAEAPSSSSRSPRRPVRQRRTSSLRRQDADPGQDQEFWARRAATMILKSRGGPGSVRTSVSPLSVSSCSISTACLSRAA
jgi:hypothetical protein